LCKTVAENYIALKKYDWKFKFVFGDEIRLNKKQEELFSELRQLKSKSAFKIHLGKLNNQFDRSAPTLFVASQVDTEFVMFGKNGRRFKVETLYKNVIVMPCPTGQS
jgi:hypothetical protein